VPVKRFGNIGGSGLQLPTYRRENTVSARTYSLGGFGTVRGLGGFTLSLRRLPWGWEWGNWSYPMTRYRREAFQPEELSILGSAFDQIWNTVSSELGDIDPVRKIAARKRLANIMVLLATLGEFDAEEIKNMSIRIFRSIELCTPANVVAGPERIYGHELGSAPRTVHQKA
jgi:hypothetical protein